MRKFASNYIRTAQLVYDLMPLANAISNDPYLASFPPGQELLSSYKVQIERTHLEMIRKI